MSNKKFLAKYGSAEHIHHILDNKHLGSDTAYYAFENPNLNGSHVSKALDHADENIRSIAAGSHLATPEHIDKALSDKSSYVREIAISNFNASSENIDKVIKNSDGINTSNMLSSAVRHHNATPEHIMFGLKHNNGRIQSAAGMGKELNADHIKYINDHMTTSHPNVLIHALLSKHITSDMVEKALTHHNPDIQRETIRHPKMTPDMLKRHLHELHPDNVKVALNSRHADHDFVNKAIMHSNPLVSITAASTNKASADVIDHAIANHPNIPLREALKSFRKN